jgi:hypothetical protein
MVLVYTGWAGESQLAAWMLLIYMAGDRLVVFLVFLSRAELGLFRRLLVWGLGVTIP